jgi:hypothetical protein
MRFFFKEPLAIWILLQNFYKTTTWSNLSRLEQPILSNIFFAIQTVECKMKFRLTLAYWLIKWNLAIRILYSVLFSDKQLLRIKKCIIPFSNRSLSVKPRGLICSIHSSIQHHHFKNYILARFFFNRFTFDFIIWHWLKGNETYSKMLQIINYL